MKPKDAFGVVVRSSGLLLLSYSFVFLIATANGGSFLPSFLLNFVLFVASAYLLRGAPLIVKWAYWEEDLAARSREPSGEALPTEADPRGR